MCCGLALCATTRAQGISTVSPFLPSGSGAVAAATENSPIELRGIISSQGTHIFGLFDPVKRAATWTKLNEPGHDVLVRSFDAANDSVTVEYQGRVLTLALKAAKIETASAIPQMMAPPVASRPPAAGPQIAPGVAAAASDQQRLEAVAAEVRRRRAQRQAAAQQQPAPAPQPGR